MHGAGVELGRYEHDRIAGAGELARYAVASSDHGHRAFSDRRGVELLREGDGDVPVDRDPRLASTGLGGGDRQPSFITTTAAAVVLFAARGGRGRGRPPLRWLSILLDILPLVGQIDCMGRVKKAKVSVTIASDLLAEIDAFAARSGIGNRSNVIELWLRRVARQQVANRLAEDTVAYYTGLTDTDARDDAEWAAASVGEFARLDFD